MAEKSLVNADAEMLGAAPADVLAVLVPAADELELDDELPQPASNPATTSAGTIARLQPAMKLLLSTEGASRWPSVSKSISPPEPGAQKSSHTGGVLSTNTNLAPIVLLLPDLGRSAASRPF
jgi:hypothetical protein